MSWLSGARARLHLLFAGRAAEARMKKEVSFHIDMETDRLVREQHLSPDEARRHALVSFGGVTQHTETLRAGRGLAWLGGLSLDTKLGFRMLVKYPGLTIVGGLAMAFAIWVGAVTFEMVRLIAFPSLPLPGGDRIVQIRNYDLSESEVEPRALYDFLIWRQTLKSVSDLGAYRDVTQNLIVDGDARRALIAEISASAFRVASARPVLGRVLAAADERLDAPPVVLIGSDVWRTRFASDPGAIGRSVQIGETHATVIGVMPEGFAFPVAHELWMPLKIDGLDRAPRAGPAITVFGRLAPGVKLEAANAELAVVGRRMATDLKVTHEHLQPQIGLYAKMASEMGTGNRALMLSFNLFAIMLVVVLCGNVALLLFARAATRETELAVRSAIGASRRRIIAQLFTEALVLGGVAAVVGLAGASLALDRWGHEYLRVNMDSLPFWYDPHLSPLTVVYALVLTVLGAAIAGGVPGLKVTRALGSRLKEGSAGSGLRFGGVWTAVIVLQVALTVAFPAAVFFEQRELARIASSDAGFRSEEYLTMRLEMDPAGTDSAALAAQRVRLSAALESMRRRVEAEPTVGGVTFVDRLPRMPHSERAYELDGGLSTATATASGASTPREVSLAYVDPSYFPVLNAPILAGRGFNAGDLTSNARVVIVDKGFVDQLLVGRNPIGQRLHIGESRYADKEDDSRPWYEIVGVVKELGMADAVHRGRPAGIYRPLTTDGGGSRNIVVHAHGDPLALVPRMRAIATAVDPTLRLSEFQRMDQVTTDILWFIGLWLKITAALTATALLLSLAGIYAVLSFTVARRTREIGVRVALGAGRRSVTVAIFRRPLTQVAIGVVAGALLIAFIAVMVTGAPDGGGRFDTEWVSLGRIALLVGYSVLMFGVCLLACIVPTRRALGVEPTVALRAE